MPHRGFYRFAIAGKQKQIIRIAEVTQTGKRIEPAIERREIYVGEEASHWSPKRNALLGVKCPSFFFVAGIAPALRAGETDNRPVR